MVAVCTMAFTAEFNHSQSFTVSYWLFKVFKTCGRLVTRVTFKFSLLLELNTMFVTLLIVQYARLFQRICLTSFAVGKAPGGYSLSKRLISRLRYLKMLLKVERFSQIMMVELGCMIGLPLKGGFSTSVGRVNG